MKQKPEFDDIFMLLATQLSQRSHCVKKQVGAVLTKDTRIISVGYNGPPAGTYNCDEVWSKTGCARNLKGSCSLAIHAEQNAILYALMNQVSIQDALLYVTLSPCLPCSRLIFSAGVKKVIYRQSYATYKNLDSEEGLIFLNEFGVEVEQYRPTSRLSDYSLNLLRK
ncbi:dCMP deaminase family protein [Cardinium endosymbiont of Tipula unca]|uniref:deoxycytidylate deaminase n=1 Tax=Cardinium endosymbiont of Tipula unca TaxID=3066216 RepID=UPI0030CACFB6